MASFDFSSLSPQVFLDALGEPTSKRGNEWRWRTRGSFSVEIKEGVWFDHEANKGGGVADFLKIQNPEQSVTEILENKYNVPKLQQVQKTTYDYGPGQVIRYDSPESKEIRQVGDTKAIKVIPYREADWRDKNQIIIVEGEKCVEALWERGIASTCNAGGANKWPDELNHYFKGKDVIILPDNDEAGRKHAKLVRRKLSKTSNTVKCITLDGLPEKGDVFDWFTNPDNTIEKLKMLLAQPESPGFGYDVLTIDDLAKLPKQSWLIDGLLPRIGVGSIYGAPASYKTFLALHIGLSIASGRPVNGHEVKKGNVLYSAHEGFYGLSNRLEPAVSHHNFDRKSFHLTKREAPLDLCNTSEIEALIEVGGAYSLIIIDSLVKAISDVDENSNSEVARALRVAENLANEKECCVLLIDHTGKDIKGARGASAKLGNQDFSFYVKRAPETDRLTVKVEKQKDGPDNFTIDFKAIEKEYSTAEEAYTSVVIEEAQSKQPKLTTPKLILKALEDKQGQTFEELFTWANNHREAAGFQCFLETSFKDQLNRLVRNGKLTKLEEQFYSINASKPSDDILPPKGGVSSGDVGYL